MSWLTFALLAFASYRATRLLIEDAIFDSPRNWLLGQLDQDGKTRYLLTCYWCLGLWVSAGLTALVAPTILIWVITSLAVSAVVGLLAEKV